jgi:hypothetical protein
MKEKSHLGVLGVNGRILLRWSSRKGCVRIWIGFIWLRRRD